MSWSVSAEGTPTEVEAEMVRQFGIPLAEKPQGISDDGERQTAATAREVVLQCLDTFGTDVKKVRVSANGYISGAGNAGRVSLTIEV